jgi:DNA-binding response OmpR family regulator
MIAPMDLAGRAILVVEDDRKTAAAVRLYLQSAGCEVAVAHDGRQALEAARARRPDLVVLDVMLPEVDGLSVCRTLREEGDVPVILLTARTTEEDKLRGLDLGADDYVTKPFSPRELVARVRAVLRRAGPPEARAGNEGGPSSLRFRDLIVDLAGRAVTVRGEAVALTPNELRILETLAGAPGRTFTRAELVERALGWNFEGMDRTVDAHIKNLRRKIDPRTAEGASWIDTVYGVGYRFLGEPLGP